MMDLKQKAAHHCANAAPEKRLSTSSLCISTNQTPSSRALALNQRRAVFLIFVTRKPHLLKRAQRGENRTADPRAILPLEIGRRRLQLDLDGLCA
jgi:hypothetical protein